MNSELISVVIPVFNGAPFLAAAVASVRDQSEVAVELIVVDDGSTDGTATVAAGLPIDRFVRLPANRGVSVARNVGFAHSRGALLCFHDADDEMLPTKLARQRAFLVEHGGSGVFVDQIVSLLPNVAAPPWLAPHELDAPSAYPGSALFHASALLLIGGWEPTLRIAEDIELFGRLRVAGSPMAHLGDPLLRRWVHGANVTYGLVKAEGALAIARLAMQQRKYPPAEVGRIELDATDVAAWGSAVARNHAVLLSRNSILTFAHPGRPETAITDAVALLHRDAAVDVVGDGGEGTPPLAARRHAIAATGLWEPDGPDATACRAWWQAASRTHSVASVAATGSSTQH